VTSQVGGERLLLDLDIDAFVLHRGAYTSVEAPGAVGTALNGINDRGQTTGAYQSPIEQARQADTSAAPTTGPLSAGMAPMAAPETPSDARPDGGEIGPAVLTQQPVSVVDRL
jgi:hypothetical protein